jgi:hypothetical protein
VTTYRLVLESGPQHRKTYAHVLELPGAFANGPTTGKALGRSPGTIRAFLQLLAEHGEEVDADAEVAVAVERHVTWSASCGGRSGCAKRSSRW